MEINNIFLGHHQDDLFENFFIRIFKRKWIKRSYLIRKKNKINNINFLRPLLYQKKKDLIFISKNVFNFYVKDPSNDDEKFQRIKIRKFLEELEKNGLDKKKFIKTIKNLKYSNNVVDFYVKKNLNKNSFFFKKENKIILNNNFFNNLMK